MGSGVLIDSHREGGSMCGKRGPRKIVGVGGCLMIQREKSEAHSP